MFFKRNEVTLTEDDMTFSPMTELERFASATRTIVTGLDDKIDSLEAEINMKIGQLSDLRRIHAAQVLALRHMEGNDAN